MYRLVCKRDKSITLSHRGISIMKDLFGREAYFMALIPLRGRIITILYIPNVKSITKSKFLYRNGRFITFPGSKMVSIFVAIAGVLKLYAQIEIIKTILYHPYYYFILSIFLAAEP